MYSVFIQWHKNTSNYRRFDGGLEQVNRHPILTVEAANTIAGEYLYEYNDNFTWNEDVLFNINRQESVIDVNLPIPMSYDFGDGTIYVAEVG